MNDRVVWKYVLGEPNPTGRVFVDLPEGAEPLSVALQHGDMVLWALVDPASAETAPGPYRLIVVNTGEEVPGFPEGARFLGTVTHPASGVVWHVFDGDAETTA